MNFFIVFVLLLYFNTLNAANSESDVKVAILGKLTHFITWTKPNNKTFIITVLQDKDFKKLLNNTYKNSSINNKKVFIRYADSLKEIQQPDILYIGNISQDAQYNVVSYAKKNSILTIGQDKGFAQRGGIIQLYFVSQKIRFKINHQVSMDSNLKINAALLSISTIVKGEENEK